MRSPTFYCIFAELQLSPREAACKFLEFPSPLICQKLLKRVDFLNGYHSTKVLMQDR